MRDTFDSIVDFLVVLIGGFGLLLLGYLVVDYEQPPKHCPDKAFEYIYSITHTLQEIEHV